ncbi:unnamed protein product, partial [Gongylonema pulchrum]|uniref:Matrin-type domain-containing protein n=1 Tax=Gongylonema pulchrum TaxID=637853 RepID=A0A183EPM3_9BILA
MTDVWKSNARKFCELCKVWFADNRVSIEHHENGQKHKAAVQAKIRELGKQNKQKEKAQSDLQATLSMMEAAACKSMAESTSTTPCAMIGPSPKSKTYMDPRAHSASVAAMAHQMALRRKQKMEQRKTEPSAEETKSETDSETVWVEAKTETGVPYYFHMYSG